MSDQHPHDNDSEAIIRAALRSAEPKEIDPSKHYVVVGTDGRVHHIDPDQFAGEPRHATGTHVATTVAALEAVAERHADPDTLEVWVSDAQVVAVLNPHAPGKPGWADHRVVAHLNRSPQWQHWLKLDGHQVDQVQFANHVEEGLADVAEPDGADMLEIAQTIEASSSGTFRSHQRLSNGAVEFTYNEAVEGRAGTTGQLSVPTEFVLGVPVYVGEDAYRVTARLRYRISGGSLAIGYKLDRPELVERAAVDAIAERLHDRFDRVYLGAPAQGQTRPHQQR